MDSGKNLSTNFALIDLIDRITTAIDNKEFEAGFFLICLKLLIQ